MSQLTINLGFHMPGGDIPLNTRTTSYFERTHTLSERDAVNSRSSSNDRITRKRGKKGLLTHLISSTISASVKKRPLILLSFGGARGRSDLVEWSCG